MSDTAMRIATAQREFRFASSFPVKRLAANSFLLRTSRDRVDSSRGHYNPCGVYSLDFAPVMKFAYE